MWLPLSLMKALQLLDDKPTNYSQLLLIQELPSDIGLWVTRRIDNVNGKGNLGEGRSKTEGYLVLVLNDYVDQNLNSGQNSEAHAYTDE